MVLPVLVQWVLGLAAFITAAGVVWKWGRILYRLEAAAPILLPMAQQFNPENGAMTVLERFKHLESAMEAMLCDDPLHRHRDLIDQIVANHKTDVAKAAEKLAAEINGIPKPK